jgi:hypothetical protein
LAEYFLYKRPLQSRVRNKIFKSWWCFVDGTAAGADLGEICYFE